jgi:hypothetical protein
VTDAEVAEVAVDLVATLMGDLQRRAERTAAPADPPSRLTRLRQALRGV